jgi:hypothetical protein
MTINDFRVQLATAYRGSQKVSTIKGRTLHGDIETETGRIRAYIKLLNIGDVAKEALCAVLARKLYLPVPQPFYVSIDATIAGQAVGNRYGIAFGLEDELLPFLRVRTYDGAILKELLKWPMLYRCATFDAWIGNRDRLPENLLFAGNHDFWMIDHEDALSGYLSSSSPVYSPLFEIIRNGKSEHELYQVRDQMMFYANAYTKINWEEIKSLVRPTQLPDSEEYFGSYIQQLSKRALNMRSIITAELGIRQLAMDIPSDSDKAKDVGVIKK